MKFCAQPKLDTAAFIAAARAFFCIGEDTVPVVEQRNGWTWVEMLPASPVTDAQTVGYNGA